MWFIFDAKGNPITVCDHKPDFEDLAARSEMAVESNDSTLIFPNVCLSNGKVTVLQITLTLAEGQDQAWARIKTERDKREQAGAPYLTGTLDSDSVSTQRIAIAVQAAQAAKSTGNAFTLDWTMQDNTVIAMTADQVIGMATALATHSNAVHEAARTARTAIYAATDAAGVAAAETAVVWP